MDAQERQKLQSILLAYDGYPEKLLATDLFSYQVLREVEKDMYAELAAGKPLVAYKEFIYKPQPSSKAVLNLSTSLYGYYDEKHVQLRSEDRGTTYYPLFLNICALDGVELSYEDAKSVVQTATVYVVHSPTAENYWHFEFVVYDACKNRIFPDTKPKSTPKNVSERLLSYIVTSKECLCEYADRKKYENEQITEILKEKGIIE